MVLHHIAVVKCVSGCPKIVMDTGLVVDMKLQFPGLHALLTLNLSIFCVGIFENHYSQY
jgi:hypothetical protein